MRAIVVVQQQGSTPPPPPPSGNTYAYFVYKSPDSYGQCNVVNNVIESNTCITKPLPTTSAGMQTVSFNGSYAYIVNYNGNYTQCALVGGAIESSTCNTYTPTGNGALSNPQQVAFSGSFAYFANDNGISSYYTQCAVNSNGIESATCVNYTPGNFTSGVLRGVSFYSLPQ